MVTEQTSSPTGAAPVAPGERIDDLDVVRGLALLGVLLVNLTTIFRVSLFLYLEVFHTDPDAASRAVDWVVGLAIESKAFALFSLLFGVGLAIFHERAAARGAGARRLLLRRLAILLAIGVAHLVLVWNGDILAAYAVAGLLVLPLVGRSPGASLGLALAAGALYAFAPLPDVLPHGDAALRHGQEAARAYGHGSWGEVFAFRSRETARYILPLLAVSLPRIAGLFLLGDWLWQRGVLRRPEEHLPLLRGALVLGLLVGGGATAAMAFVATTHRSLGGWEQIVSSLSNVPLALGYGAGLLLLLRRPRVRGSLTRAIGPLGRMALTNYLAQSALFSLIFYGFGAGLFGRLDAARCAAMGLVVYAAQAAASAAWLRAFRFGPVEWAWRSLTYGRRQPMRR